MTYFEHRRYGGPHIADSAELAWHDINVKATGNIIMIHVRHN